MCIRDRDEAYEYAKSWFHSPFDFVIFELPTKEQDISLSWHCLLYTSDAADERSSVDLGGRRIIKKKKKVDNISGPKLYRSQMSHEQY